MDATNVATACLLALALVGDAFAWRALAAAGAALPWQPRIADDRRLAEALERIAKKHRQPAMAVALVRGDRIVARAAVGRILDGGAQRVPPDGRFHVGSTTKGMTALLVAILVREGRLRYDDTLAARLPDIPMLDDYRAVTVRDLLLHRGGVMAMQLTEAEDPDVVERLWTELPARELDPTTQRVEMARLVLARPPIAAVGRQHVYSNVGYGVLGLAAERAAGASFEELMAARVFRPLGMTTARLGGWPASASDPDQPRGHYVEPQGLRAQPLDDAYVFPGWMNPAGGVHCSIEDFARYARESLRGLQGQGTLLDRAGYREMHEAHAEVRVKEMYGPSLARLTQAYGCDPGDASNAIAYGWVVVPTPDGPMSVADGSGGTFFARVAVCPPLDAALVAVTSTGNGAAAIAAACRDVTGLRWD